MKFTEFRTRWLDASGFCVVERKTHRKVLGFWPVHDWIVVARFPTRAEATAWLVDTYGEQGK